MSFVRKHFMIFVFRPGIIICVLEARKVKLAGRNFGW
jgi:hypothetical protein